MEMKGTSNNLDNGDESERMSLMSARTELLPLDQVAVERVEPMWMWFNVRLRPDDFREPLGAFARPQEVPLREPRTPGGVGAGGRNPPGYPIETFCVNRRPRLNGI